MSIRQIPLDSDALRANIARTAQEVVVPERYRPLLTALESYQGAGALLTETLGEYFHTFRNTDLLIEGFQTILLRNWNYFERSDHRDKLFALLAELVVDLLEKPLSGAQFSLLLRQLLMWCTAALNGQHPDSYENSVRLIGESLRELLPAHPVEFLERDTLLRDLVGKASARPLVASVFYDLYASVLLVGYRRLAERLDVPAWASAVGADLTDPAPVAEHFAFLAKDRLNALIRGVEAAKGPELLTEDKPAFSDLLDQAIAQIFQVENLEDRFAVCVYFLKDDTLGYRQNEAMVDLLGVVKQMMQPDKHLDVEKILSRLTLFFRDRDNQFLLMRFQCYEAIGVAIGEAGNVNAVHHFVEDVLSWKFQYPEIRGATDEWETVVNPYHLPKIRCWMHIIESNPALYERLAAALNVQLRLGGVHISDTDLFQRDVTRFLNTEIRPIYFVAKQLLRTLPVYFNEVGAEGELRSVSTEIDEICGRRDTLMHFLRKQSHAESSNRLVAFSRAILKYWVTLDPSGLEQYLSLNTMRAVENEAEWAQGPHGALLALRPALIPSGDGGGPRQAGRRSHTAATAVAAEARVAPEATVAPAATVAPCWPGT